MKSVFQEGSSLSNAVQKAWETAGEPEYFEIKVLEVGAYNFFGFSKKPYTISLTVINKESTANSNVASTISGQRPARLDRKSAPTRFAGKSIDNIVEEASAEKKNNYSDSRSDRFNKRGSTRDNRLRDKDFHRPVSESKITDNPELEVEPDNWTNAFAETAEQYLLSILNILEVDSVSINRKSMDKNTLTLEVMHSSEVVFLDKAFFVSIAPLIVQMLKKASTESPRGLRIIISAQTTE